MKGEKARIKWYKGGEKNIKQEEKRRQIRDARTKLRRGKNKEGRRKTGRIKNVEEAKKNIPGKEKKQMQAVKTIGKIREHLRREQKERIQNEYK